jgi:hypothetical protein
MIVVAGQNVFHANAETGSRQENAPKRRFDSIETESL